MKNDSISRQAAIETVRRAKSIGQAHRMLLQLPSAQPSVSKMEIVEDCISRAAVLNLIEQSCCDLEYDCDNVALRKEVEALPSAQLDVPDTNVGDTDCISRADVIELVNNSYYNLAESIEDTWAMVADVEKLPPVTPKQPGWFPITERLPEEETIYLITFGSGHVRLSSWHKDTKYNHGFDNIETGFLEDGTMVHFGVTAWMPLPKPYREGDANG